MASETRLGSPQGEPNLQQETVSRERNSSETEQTGKGSEKAAGDGGGGDEQRVDHHSDPTGDETGGVKAEEGGNGPAESAAKTSGAETIPAAGPNAKNPPEKEPEKTGPQTGAFEQKNAATFDESSSSAQKPPSNTPANAPRANESNGPVESAAKSGGAETIPAAGPNAENPPDSVLENEVYRIELEFVQRDSGTHLKLRLRTRFPVDSIRSSLVLGTFKCGNLTDAQIKKARMKTLPPKVRAALAEGDLEYELINQLLNRPGKGRHAQARAEAENRDGANAYLDSNEGSGERGQDGIGNDHENGNVLDDSVFPARGITRSDRIQ